MVLILEFLLSWLTLIKVAGLFASRPEFLDNSEKK